MFHKPDHSQLMKFLLVLFSAACATVPVLFSQDSAPPPAGENPGNLAHEKVRGMMREKFLENLPPEVRSRFEAAREKAMQDPKVIELKAKLEGAGNELRGAVREAMMKVDPGLADLLKQSCGNKFKAGKEGGNPGPERPGLDQLGEGDRLKLKAAREAAKSDSTVQAAEAKRDAATNPEDRRAAGEEFRKAMRAAVLKSDPSLEPVFEQLMKAQKGAMRPKDQKGKTPGFQQNPAPE